MLRCQEIEFRCQHSLGKSKTPWDLMLPRPICGISGYSRAFNLPCISFLAMNFFASVILLGGLEARPPANCLRRGDIPLELQICSRWALNRGRPIGPIDGAWPPYRE